MELSFDENMFNGADDADVMGNAGSGLYVQAGHYLVGIDRIKAGEGQKGEFVIVEATVLHDFGDGASPINNAGVQDSALRMQVGSEVSDYYTPVGGKWQKKYFLSDVKKIVAAVMGIPASDVTSAQIARVIRDGLAEGLVIEMNNTLKPHKDNSARAPEDRVFYTQSGYVRSRPASEFAGILDEKVLANRFGEGDVDAARAKIAALIDAE